MRHAKPYRKLSRQRSHYRSLMRNLAIALFDNERIETTLTKAKEVRRFVDQIITLARSGTLHDRRRAFALLGNITILDSSTSERTDPLTKVFKEIGPRMKDRKGGYTRIMKTGYRAGDAAPMAILELVDAKALDKASPKEDVAEAKKPAKKRATTAKKKKAASAKAA